MLTILSVTGPLFLIILIGVVLRLTKIADNHWVEILNKFGLYGGFVPLVIQALAHTNRQEILNGQLVLVNAGLLISAVLLTWLITSWLKVKAELANSYVLGIFMGNVAYLGFPFITALYPATAGVASLHLAIYLIVLLTLGVAIMERKALKKKHWGKVVAHAFFNPLFLAVIIGLALLFSGITLPKAVDDTLGLLAKSSSPVVLVALGIFLARKIKIDADFWHALVISSVKLLVLPAVFFVLALALGRLPDFRVSILDAGMPLAVTVFAFTEIYPLRKQVVANTIVISTILSAFTLVAWAWVIR